MVGGQNIYFMNKLIFNCVSFMFKRNHHLE